MKIGLKDFRAFGDTGLLDIRPLTFLVGENSSGKTSLLAALNYVWRFNERLQAASFNRAPFDLGTFDEIVHSVRGRTRPDCFTITVQNEIVTTHPRRRGIGSVRRRELERQAGTAKLRLIFANNVGETELVKFQLDFNEFQLFMEFGDDVKAALFENGEKLLDSSKGSTRLPLPRTATVGSRVDLSFIEIFLSRLMYETSADPAEINPQVYAAVSRVQAALEAMTDSFPRAIFASAPVRSSPRRVYTPTDQSRSPEGQHTPQVLFKIKETDPSRWSKIRQGLERFGRMSGLFSKIDVSRYRKSGSSPFHINVTLKGKQSNLIDVGYGISQALPILADLIESPPRSAFLFQQPEVHLHPRAQAALGSFLAEYVSEHRSSYVIAETHSDYLIDRVRYEVRNGTIRASDVSILYFESVGTDVKISQIGVDSEGNIENAPDTYRDFFVFEQMKLLGLDEDVDVLGN